MSEKRKKVVVFGGSGFIGSHVADHLSENGYKVYIYDLKESSYLRPDQEIVKGDILNINEVGKVTKNTYAVFNFAGIADLDDALDKPTQTVMSNILGTINILEACRKNKINRFIYASTVYIHSREGGFYRCSKLAAEQYIEEYYKRYGLDYCILRYGSLYGPRSGPDNGLWRILHNAIESGEIRYMGHPESSREYIHVQDAARASLKALDDDFRNQHIVLTGQEPMKVIDLLKMIGEILGITKDIKFQDNLFAGHYIRTPYSYNEKVGRKYRSSIHVDLGQGLLQMIKEITNNNQ